MTDREKIFIANPESFIGPTHRTNEKAR
jgi:hypothetical protein